jgi:hypothetical protein
MEQPSGSRAVQGGEAGELLRAALQEAREA